MRVPADGETVRGVDISHHNGMIDWKVLTQTDIEFCFIKATDGGSYRDTKFMDNWDGAKASGLIKGAYHFFRGRVDVEKQVENFVRTVQHRSDKNDLPPVLDWEGDDVTFGGEYGTGQYNSPDAVLHWLAAVEKSFGKTPILYVSPSYFEAHHGNKAFARYPLWIANYGAKAPTVPSAWKKWTFWQYSESGIVNGIHGNVDMDLFNGTLDQLKALASPVPLSLG